MSAGELDRRVRFERKTVEDDGFSADGTVSWVPIATVWASVVAVSDGEKWRAGALGAIVSHRIRVRFSSVFADLTAADRVVYRGDVLEIGAVKELGRREFLEITANEARK